MIALDTYGIFAKLLKIFSLKINWSKILFLLKNLQSEIFEKSSQLF